MDVVLQVKGVKKVYGNRGHAVTVLQDIDLEIAKGEFVGIMGPSGSGKSTLLNVLSTIDQPTAGMIKINNQMVTELNDEELSTFRREKLGFIFQDYNLLDTLTVKENISLPLALSRVSSTQIEKNVLNAAKNLGIDSILERYPHEVSGGQQQRAAIARAIVMNPSLLFADEPTGALDSRTSLQLLESLSAINEKEDATILMVTHDAFAASFCKRVVFIKDGNIVTEIRKGEQVRKQFYQQIIDILTTLGGGLS